jgi:uncharacterized membrane protein
MDSDVPEMRQEVTEVTATRRDQRWAWWMEFCGKYARCHQMPERSFFLGSYQCPLCARCTGIMAGRVIAILLFPFFLLPLETSLIVFPLLMLPLAIDGLTQRFTSYTSNNFKRVTTGVLWGFASVSLLLRGILFLVMRIAKVG